MKYLARSINSIVLPVACKSHHARTSFTQRHIFKTVLLVYKTLQGDGPSYLQDLLKPYSCDRDGMRSQMTSLVSMSPLLNTNLLVIVLSACLAPKCGICYLRTSGCPLQLLHSKLPLKPIFFKLHIRNYFFRHILFHLNAYYTN